MNVFEAFNLMNAGHIVKDDYGYWFKKDDNQLIDSIDEGKTWHPTEEFKYGYINQKWHLVK
ncbi:hypothetical protein [Paenibacillus sp. NAIST15-1]|uniref:hypothetical protein n=1 Tax=Paenibacillus sp. NAIST15-1 TaxID=1605994 RepID=UPI00086DFEE6|nr:hypothetical protein [Paenibacillus sp. NAIST15-1]GAV11417.1 hypothetical protein PBN151_1346 [Paenibacillus sp. NAIST15-1]